MSNQQNDIYNEQVKETIEEDLNSANKENYETRRELAEMGYYSPICTVCFDPACNGEYSHFNPFELT